VRKSYNRNTRVDLAGICSAANIN